MSESLADRALILIGARGSGKSTVGRLLAERLQCAFVDLDKEIQREVGRGIAEIFAADGEPAFRDLESAALQRAVDALSAVSPGPRGVIAAGGGIVLRSANQNLLQNKTFPIWLKASAAALHQRTQRDQKSPAQRPALTSLDPLAEMQAILEQRSPIYAAMAEIVIEAEDKQPAGIVDEIVTQLQTIPHHG